MNFKISFSIAKTHLLSRRKQTAIAALGVTFGIAMFIAMISFMTGVDKLLEDTMLSSSPHVHIYNDVKSARPSILQKLTGIDQSVILHHQRPKKEGVSLKNGMQMIDFIRKDPRVSGVSGYVSSQVFYNYGVLQIGGVISGVDILEENNLFDIASKMKQGRIEDLLSSSNGIIIGAGLARKLNVNKGDRINITTPAGVVMTLNVVGVFKIGIGQIDDVKSYANLNTVQKILQKDKSYITDINIKLHDLYLSGQVATEYQTAFRYRADDWQTANANILVSFKIRGAVTYATVVTLLLVAGFGIYNIMNMTIYEKMKDIAILKATGFTGKDVSVIFIMEALMIGIGGGVLGLLLGFLLSLGISRVPFDTGGVLATDFMPVNFALRFYVTGIVFGIITTFFAGLLPSRKAGKIDPVEILRG